MTVFDWIRDASATNGPTWQYSYQAGESSQRQRLRLDDLEFSEYGRDPRFAEYFLPVLAMGMMALVIASFLL